MKEKNVKTKTPNKKALGLTTKIFIALLAGAILGIVLCYLVPDSSFKKDVIIEAMNRSFKPLTKVEVASLLKSKSIGHAGYYLDQMLEEGSIVQVERMLYTTPQLAYKNIDLNIYINSINDILCEYLKPVEPSIFKEKLKISTILGLLLGLAGVLCLSIAI